MLGARLKTQIAARSPLDWGRERVIAATQDLFSHGDYPLAGTLAYQGDPGLFGPGSATWSIVGDSSVFVGGASAPFWSKRRIPKWRQGYLSTLVTERTRSVASRGLSLMLRPRHMGPWLRLRPPSPGSAAGTGLSTAFRIGACLTMRPTLRLMPGCTTRSLTRS